MHLLPMPKSIITNEGYFSISPKTEIVLDVNCNFNNLKAAQMLQSEIKEQLGFTLPIRKAFNTGDNSIYLTKKENSTESYNMVINNNHIAITGYGDNGLFYGIQTLRQIIRTGTRRLQCMEIDDSPYFKMRGFYHDITRGKVPTLDTLKKLADKAAFYKINQLQLYVEHTFAFKNHSEVWTGADPITAEEILLLDEYCKDRHIELVPSLATFGHLYHALSSHTFDELCELENSTERPFSWMDRMAHHTLDVSNEKSIKFIQDMLKEFIPLFSSNKFNICADETFDLGKGKSIYLAEKEETGRLYIDFLNKIIQSVKQYDKEVMFWGDIILKHPELINEIPKDVICLNWEYSKDPNENKIKTIADSGLKQCVCPGVSGWDRFMNDFDVAFSNICKMAKYAKKYNAVGILNTDWGDYGHINLLSNSMPGMIYGAALSWNPNFKEDITTIDNMISTLEFNNESTNLIGLLRELSRQQVITWAEIIWWKEHYFNECYGYDRLLERLDKEFNKTSENEVVKKYNKTLEIKNKILDQFSNTKQSKILTLEEFCVSANAIALINSFFLILKKYEAKNNINYLIHQPIDLANQLEYWFSDFSKVWRQRNKESELYRIKDTIIQLCRYLRKLHN